MILPVLALVAIALPSPGATAKSSKKHHPTKTSATTHPYKHSAPASKGQALKAPQATKAPKASKITGHHKVRTRAAVRSFQQTPTQERYREIQQALAAKGYFHGEPNGEWGADSIDALKRFQTDQSLMPDGKISSLSLIALGLGPKRLTAAKSDVPSQVVPRTDPQGAPGAIPATPRPAGAPAPSSAPPQ